MNDSIKAVIQVKVFDKLTKVDKEEYDRHVNASVKDSMYGIGTLAIKQYGYYIFSNDDQPDFNLLDKMYLQGLWEQFKV